MQVRLVGPPLAALAVDLTRDSSGGKESVTKSKVRGRCWGGYWWKAKRHAAL